jgi:hypothetical protein
MMVSTAVSAGADSVSGAIFSRCVPRVHSNVPDNLITSVS